MVCMVVIKVVFFICVDVFFDVDFCLDVFVVEVGIFNWVKFEFRFCVLEY